MRSIIHHFLLFAIAATLVVGGHFAQAQPSFTGRWEGAINLPGMNLGIIVNVTRTGDSLHGTIDIPMQMAKNLQLRDMTWTGPAVRFALQAGPGLASFNGTLAGDSVAGIFTQATVRCPFILRRAVPPVAAPPPPYAVEEVMIPSADAKLAGTLTLPVSPGPHPAVILITGSGAQTRDEEIFGFAIFKTIADHLTRNGIAVLRCDDRGVGSSTGDFAKAITDDFAADACAQVQFLKKREDIDQHAIGLLGHSEGGLVATMLSAKDQDVAFVVLLAGPAVRGDKVILGQIERMVRGSGATDSTLQEALRMQERVYESVRADTGWAGVRSMLLDGMKKSIGEMSAEQRASSGLSDSVLSARVDAQMSQIRSPWFHRFVTYDPAPDLRKIACPVLALYGSLDSQAPPAQSRPVLEEIFASAGKKNAIIRTFEGANHLFQAAISGSPTEYGTLKKEFLPGVMDAITGWLVQTVGRR
jgi:uncharacterized protein